MNKKIFTLLVGACISIGSLFTVNAQRNHPYTPKASGDVTSFYDLLTADTVKKLPSSKEYFYLLGVTGLANPASDQVSTGLSSNLTAGLNSTEQSYVMYVDDATDDVKYLRIETLAKLDTTYSFQFGDSYKFGAIRRASWCINYEQLDNGPNIGYDFTNMNTGRLLEAPIIYDNPEMWVNDEDGKKVYAGDGGNGINTFDEDLIINGWHFSQTYLPTQNLQTGMPLYSYVTKDTVAVLVLAADKYVDADTVANATSGGYYVTVKHVAVADLINNDNARSVKIGADGIKNVLLFTLKKVNKFVLNADDWNAVNANITFNSNANTKVKYGNGIGGEYLNPFTDQALTAYEVNDSLYHYGYMQFQSPSSAGQFLYVDTVWANEGNYKYLAFSWGPRRDSTLHSLNLTNPGEYAKLYWGDSFTPWVSTNPTKKPDSVAYLTDPDGGAWIGGSVYWRLDSIVWAIVDDIVATNTLTLDNSGLLQINEVGSTYNVDAALKTKWDEIAAEAAAIYAKLGLTNPTAPVDPFSLTNSGSSVAVGRDYVARIPQEPRDYTSAIEARAKYLSDSVSYIAAYMKDSIMENQSKFRVVYDPFADSTFINVYQSRVRHQDAYSKVWPYWWENSFSRQELNGKLYFVRPSDFHTNVLYGGDAYTIGSPQSSITDAAAVYYTTYVSQIPLYSGVSKFSDVSVGTSPYYEGHGDISNPPGLNNFHSELQYYATSSPSNMDKVMISTADTVVIFNEYDGGNNKSALSHMYGWSMTGNGERKYQDSLFYVNLQSLEGTGKTIITLDQSYQNGVKGLDTKISLKFGEKCVEEEIAVKATIKNDLYLIRNADGEYLAVPISSILDSVYWVTPGHGEDPTRIPSYQWAIINTRGTAHSPFRMVNREFERVEFPYVFVYENQAGPFQIAGEYRNAKFNNRVVRGGSTSEGQALSKGEVDPYNFVSELEKRFNRNDISFIRLGKDVKEDQLLGYKYLDRDATFIDVYAVKYYNGLALGDDAKFLSWNGYDEGSEDTTLWVKGKDEFDKLYFELKEMRDADIYPLDNYKNGSQGKITLTAANTQAGKDNADFADLYKDLASKDRQYYNADSIVLERFGYYESGKIDYLKPLARQAYRLFLKDKFYWHKTVQGHYMVPGASDRYVLADGAYQSQKYQPGITNNVAGLFGIPHYYFRNTYFDIQAPGDDYFAMIQRLDTVIDNQYNSTSYGNVEKYLIERFGSEVGGKLTKKIRENNEFRLFAVLVEDATGQVIYAVRGESVASVSTYQLSQDNEPIYRRLHVNEPDGNFYPEKNDNPDTLEFHILNNDKGGLRLYENTGHYKSEANPVTDLRGPCGGRIYNIDENGNYKRDAEGNVISFLGINVQVEFPKENYAFYVDTAYINRGTGWIKPQYMLVVDPYIPEECGVCNPATGNLEGANTNYVIGRYLYNTAMYARSVVDSVENKDYGYDYTDKYYENIKNAQGKYTSGYLYRSDNYNKVQPINYTDTKKVNGEAYRYNKDWERFAFAWAIHKGDSLYVLKGVEPLYNDNEVNDPKDLWQKLSAEYGSPGSYVNFNELVEWNTTGTYQEAYYPLGERSLYPEMRTYRTYKTMDEVEKGGKSIGLQAIIALDDNTHKDWVFSFRYIQRRASDFVIESETTDRDTKYGDVIRPGQGGWMKSDNGVPTITRMDANAKALMSESAIFNVNRGSNPVANEDVKTSASKLTVIGGTGSVTILNVAGKNVVISNILGQTIVNTKITSDNVSIAVPAGIVVVAVEGENAVKALVK